MLTIVLYRTSAMRGSWEKLEGKFSLSTMPDRAIFYLEGPAPGVDILIRSVEINCSSPNNNVCHEIMNYEYCYFFVQFYIVANSTIV